MIASIRITQQFARALRCMSSSSSAKISGQEAIAIEMKGKRDTLNRYLWLRCAGHEVGILDSYEKFLKMAAKHLDIEFVKTEEPWRNIKRRTLLASRHVHKKYRVQYEIRTYYRNLLFKNLTGSTTDTFLEYVERNLPEGLSLIAEKHQLANLPFDLEKSAEEVE